MSKINTFPLTRRPNFSFNGANDLNLYADYDFNPYSVFVPDANANNNDGNDNGNNNNRRNGGANVVGINAANSNATSNSNLASLAVN